MPAATCTRLVPGAADLEKDAVLALERDFAVVQPARGVHEAERADQLFGLQIVKPSH